MGKSGLRLSHTLSLFESQLPEHIDILFVNIGANDCKDGTAIATWLRSWHHILSTLRIRYPSAFFICSGIPPFRYFPALPWPVQFFLGCRSDVMNHLLSREIQSWEHCVFLPLPSILSEDYFADDRFHPNAKAHREWAQGIFEEILKTNNILKHI